jgi:mRNA interferase MazF
VYIPKRGDFIWIDFDPQAGHEQSASRSSEVSSEACVARLGNQPALVISHDNFNEQMGFAYVCPISNTQRKNPFYVVIPEGEAVTGVIMTEQMRSLDFRAKKATFKGVCPELLLQDCLRRIKPIIF